MANHTTLHINCLPNQKEAWLRTAQVRNMSFEDWVIQQLNTSVVDTRPTWASGLSDRAIIGLLSAGLDSRDAIVQAANNGFDFAALQNVGKRGAEEILRWVK